MNEKKPEVFTFTKYIPCVDVDGRTIVEGSVLKSIEDGCRGVVVEICRAGVVTNTLLGAVGDIRIQLSRGSWRVTNNYSKWKHIPHDEQTYDERLLSWFTMPFEHDTDLIKSKEEALAVSGIMSLLPESVVDWDYGPFPDSIDSALRFLCDHLSTLKAELDTLKKVEK